MVQPLRHRQTKGAATAMFYLMPPRHIHTLPPIHMSGELFKMLTGTDMLHVPYRGGAPALTDLISGQVHVMFDNIPTCAEHVKSGKLRGLAVTSTTRSSGFADF